jgi:hypothetical protein
MVLRKTRTKTGAQIEFDLKLYPMLLEEIARVSKETRIGPMIISEHTRGSSWLVAQICSTSPLP